MQGDLIDISKIMDDIHENNFNAAISMFSSIGYYGIDSDIRLFKALFGLSNIGGLLVIDTITRDWLLDNFQPPRQQLRFRSRTSSRSRIVMPRSRIHRPRLTG